VTGVRNDFGLEGGQRLADACFVGGAEVGVDGQHRNPDLREHRLEVHAEQRFQRGNSHFRWFQRHVVGDLLYKQGISSLFKQLFGCVLAHGADEVGTEGSDALLYLSHRQRWQADGFQGVNYDDADDTIADARGRFQRDSSAH